MAADSYLDYLARFEEKVGAVAVGGYGKFHGKLVRKLSAEEFTQRHSEFAALDETYRGIIQRGDTINDAIVSENDSSPYTGNDTFRSGKSARFP